MKNSPQRFSDFEYTVNKNVVTLIRYIGDKTENVAIPAYIDNKPVHAIGENCFFDHPEIKGISFPNTLVSIGKNAFSLCRGIHELILPDSITNIGAYAFCDCKGLRNGTVKLPANLKRLSHGLFAFTYMTGVDITLPSYLEVIERAAFYSAGAFDLVIPDSVVEIQTGAFAQSAVHVVTSLPEQKSWYLDWPCGEEIVRDNGERGVVTDVRPLPHGCMVLTVDFCDHSEQLFFPSVPESAYTFADSKSQDSMNHMFMDRSETVEIFHQWQRGLL